ncbi:hypothetical protein TEQG_07112 [Trichophyton equinum CBS 127.97]|uniref:Uncharacterized protein n=1 Tax=Trichophyton equinum (strain ATCC MYA-4606 / CBS 127.97) TaxID=559882 RepID=F2Q1M8_TRIEC|nr:hypothetical protein TEQG_07112 [Trichophyton equinum CBS 127.97]
MMKTYVQGPIICHRATVARAEAGKQPYPIGDQGEIFACVGAGSKVLACGDRLGVPDRVRVSDWCMYTLSSSKKLRYDLEIYHTRHGPHIIITRLTTIPIVWDTEPSAPYSARRLCRRLSLGSGLMAKRGCEWSEAWDGVSSMEEENGSGFSLPAVSYVSYTAKLHASIQLIKQQKRSRSGLASRMQDGPRQCRRAGQVGRQFGGTFDKHFDVRDETSRRTTESCWLARDETDGVLDTEGFTLKCASNPLS